MINLKYKYYMIKEEQFKADIMNKNRIKEHKKKNMRPF